MSLFPTTGFLGVGAPFSADLNIVLQVVMGIALVSGAILAKRRNYTAHGICQTTVLIVNLGMIGLVMWPSFQEQVRPMLPKGFHKWYYAASTIHALLGVMAELLGLYIVTVAGTNLLPRYLRFRDWKRWMRVELVLWSVTLMTGIGTYFAWYIAPFR